MLSGSPSVIAFAETFALFSRKFWHACLAVWSALTRLHARRTFAAAEARAAALLHRHLRRRDGADLASACVKVMSRR